LVDERVDFIHEGADLFTHAPVSLFLLDRLLLDHDFRGQVEGALIDYSFLLNVPARIEIMLTFLLRTG